MPHIVLQHSTNLVEKDFSKFFHDAHKLIAKALPSEISRCKSRAIPCSEYLVGTGNTSDAFAHLEVSFASGPSSRLIQITGVQILELLTKHLAQSVAKLHPQISVEFHEFGVHYFCKN